MAALTGPTQRNRRGPVLHEQSGYLKDGYTVYVGSVVCYDGVDGYMVPGAARTGLIPVGIFDPKVGSVLNNGALTNALGNSDTSVRVNTTGGIYDMINGTGSDAVLQSDVGNLCYMLDDQTVSRLSAAKSALGRVTFVNGDGTISVFISGATAVNAD